MNAAPGRPGQLHGCAVFLLPRSSLAHFFAILLFYFFLLADAKMKNDSPPKYPDGGVNFNSFPLLVVQCTVIAHGRAQAMSFQV